MQAESNKKRASKLRRNLLPNYDYIFMQTSTKPTNKNNGFLSKLIKINAWPLILSSLIYVLQALPTWLMPLITANVINIVTNAVTLGTGFTDQVILQLSLNLIILFVAILQNIPTTVWRNVIMSKMLRTTSAGIKSSVVRKLQSLSITYHKDMQTGKIQSKFLKDTDAVDGLFNHVLQSFIPLTISAVISAVISISKNWIVALFFVLVIPCNVALTFIFRKKLRERNRDMRLQTEGMSMRLSTMLEMMAVTKAHGLERTEISSVNQSILSVAGSGRKIDKTNAYFGASVWVVNVMLSSLCLAFCSVLAIFGFISIGDIVLFQTMFTSISSSITGLINLMPAMTAGYEALNSVSEIMNATDIEVTIGKKHVSKIDGNITFEKVYYKYPNTKNYVIKNLNLQVKKGECIAVVGASGSGKSTIMNMIIGFLPPSKGEITIDGKSIKDFNLSEYRQHISVVPQNSILFNGTIKENITYGLSHYNKKQLEEVIEMANLKEFIKDLPQGINTQIGEHGDKLSGGQKQRITIARALIRNPEILILDEATSALDNISEYHVQKAIESCVKGRTTFIVAHRLSTIRNADRIVVMEDGKCVEIGTYDELMQLKGKFYELKNLSDINTKVAQEALG